jgi:hypothetical protein
MRHLPFPAVACPISAALAAVMIYTVSLQQLETFPLDAPLPSSRIAGLAGAPALFATA